MSIEQRAYYGAKLEPKNNIIHCIGQSKDAFDDYIILAAAHLKPLAYMSYMSVKKCESYPSALKKTLLEYPWYLGAQVGLSMTFDGNPECHYEHEVADGKFDDAIQKCLYELNEINRPIWLRIGYEFTGTWNGYQPDTYRKAFQKIAAFIRNSNYKNIAACWCHAPEVTPPNLLDFYPGDEFVDWFGIDPFDADHMDSNDTELFLTLAEKHKKPVLIGESTPRRVGVLDSEKSWDTWFKPFFNMIHKWRGIKMLSYINWNWIGRRAGEMSDWSDWGDGRIEANETVKSLWNEELENPIYVHGNDEINIRKLLRMD